MDKLKVIIGEDDELQALKLEALLTNLDYEVIGISDKPGILKRLIEHQRPDIVLMDINLGETLDGIDIINTGKFENEFILIYISSLGDNQTLNRVKETYPDAFLVKPVSEFQMQSTIELALYKKALKKENSNIDNIKPLECDQDILQLRSTVFIKIGSKLRKFQVADISYISASRDKYSDIHSQSKTYPVRKTLNELQSILGPTFERIHRSYLINLNHIKSFNSSLVELNDGTHLNISKSFKNNLEVKLKLIS